MNEMNKGVLMDFLKIFLVRGGGANGLFRTQTRDFLKFCTMKGAQRHMNIILIVFLKKSSSGLMDHFGPENGEPS